MKKEPFKILLNILIAIILILAVRFLSKGITGLLSNWINSNYTIEFKFESSLYKFLELFFSLLIMLIIPGYTLRDFGFRKPKKIKYFRIIWLTFAVVIGGMMVFGSLYMGLLNSLFGGGMEPLAGMGGNQSFLTVLLTIWILSSIAEEIYARGLFQSLLDKLKKYRFLKLSLPVWFSGIAFGLLHISIYEPGRIFFTLFVVSQAMALGVLAAYYREKSMSLYPAIMVHILGNIYGSAVQFIT